MSREDDFATRLNDATLNAILTGGIYKAGNVGIEGITRESAAAAFDSDGYLKPCALIRQRGNVPDRVLVDETALLHSAVQVVEVYFYEYSGYTQIDLAMARARVLLSGYQLADSFEVQLANVVDRTRDTGALDGASLARQDWQVNNVMS